MLKKELTEWDTNSVRRIDGQNSRKGRKIARKGKIEGKGKTHTHLMCIGLIAFENYSLKPFGFSYCTLTCTQSYRIAILLMCIKWKMENHWLYQKKKLLMLHAYLRRIVAVCSGLCVLVAAEESKCDMHIAGSMSVFRNKKEFTRFAVCRCRCRCRRFRFVSFCVV